MTIEKFIQGYLCPVCGFRLSKPPADFLICSSCGTEFGNDDLDWTYEELRRQWIADGMQWWSKSESAPACWSPILQLLEVTALEGSWDIQTTVAADDHVYFDEPEVGKGYLRLSTVAA